MRPFMQRRYGNIIKNYVRKEIEARFLELKSGSTLERKKAQSVISLALDAYISSKSDKQGVFPAALDESFVETVIDQSSTAFPLRWQRYHLKHDCLLLP